MSDPTTLYMFGPDEPFTPEKLQHNLQALALGVERLGRKRVYQVPPGNIGQAMRIRGGRFTGPVYAPSVALRATDGSLTVPVTDADLAGPAALGVVKAGAAVADPAGGASLGARLDACGASFNALLASLRAAGSMES